MVHEGPVNNSENVRSAQIEKIRNSQESMAERLKDISDEDLKKLEENLFNNTGEYISALLSIKDESTQENVIKRLEQYVRLLSQDIGSLSKQETEDRKAMMKEIEEEIEALVV